MKNKQLEKLLQKVLDYPDDKFRSNAFSPKEIKESLEDAYSEVANSNEVEEVEEFTQELKDYEAVIKTGDDLIFPYLI